MIKNINPCRTTVNSNSIPLNTLPLDNCDEPNMPSEHDSSNFWKAQVKSKSRIFKKKGLHLLHFNVNCLQPKTCDILYIAKQSNASIIGTSESK